MSTKQGRGPQRPRSIEDQRQQQAEHLTEMVVHQGEAFFKIEKGEELTDQEFFSLPTARKIFSYFVEMKAPRKVLIDPDMVKERDYRIQEYVVNRLIGNLNSAASNESRAGWYSAIRFRLEQFGLTPAQYLKKHADSEHIKIVEASFRKGGGALVQAELSDIFDTVSHAANLMTEDDIMTLRNAKASPNERLEALLHGVDRRTAFNLLGTIEQAGFDYDDEDLVDRIMPQSVSVLVKNSEPAVH